MNHFPHHKGNQECNGCSSSSSSSVALISRNSLGKLEITKEAREFLFSLPDHIHLGVLNMIGPRSTGKSALLDQLFEEKSFQQHHSNSINELTQHSCTKGLWISNRVYTSNYTNFSYLVIDSECLEGIDQYNQTSIQLFSLNLLLSSMLVLNTLESIEESISCFLKKLKLAQQHYMKFAWFQGGESHGEGAEKQNGINNKDSTSFLWIIHDFQLRIQDGSGRLINPQKYLEGQLEEKNDSIEVAAALNPVRQFFKNHFKDRDCCTIVKPCEYDDDQSNRMDRIEGQFGFSLSQGYVEGVQRVHENIGLRIRPKKVNGQSINGKGFLSLLEKCLLELNSSKEILNNNNNMPPVPPRPLSNPKNNKISLEGCGRQSSDGEDVLRGRIEVLKQALVSKQNVAASLSEQLEKMNYELERQRDCIVNLITEQKIKVSEHSSSLKELESKNRILQSEVERLKGCSEELDSVKEQLAKEKARSKLDGDTEKWSRDRSLMENQLSFLKEQLIESKAINEKNSFVDEESRKRLNSDQSEDKSRNNNVSQFEELIQYKLMFEKCSGLTCYQCLQYYSKDGFQHHLNICSMVPPPNSSFSSENPYEQLNLQSSQKIVPQHPSKLNSYREQHNQKKPTNMISQSSNYSNKEISIASSTSRLSSISTQNLKSNTSKKGSNSSTSQQSFRSNQSYKEGFLLTLVESDIAMSSTSGKQLQQQSNKSNSIQKQRSNSYSDSCLKNKHHGSQQSLSARPSGDCNLNYQSMVPLKLKEKESTHLQNIQVISQKQSEDCFSTQVISTIPFEEEGKKNNLYEILVKRQKGERIIIKRKQDFIQLNQILKQQFGSLKRSVSTAEDQKKFNSLDFNFKDDPSNPEKDFKNEIQSYLDQVSLIRAIRLSKTLKQFIETSFTFNTTNRVQMPTPLNGMMLRGGIGEEERSLTNSCLFSIEDPARILGPIKDSSCLSDRSLTFSQSTCPCPNEDLKSEMMAMKLNSKEFNINYPIQDKKLFDVSASQAIPAPSITISIDPPKNSRKDSRNFKDNNKRRTSTPEKENQRSQTLLSHRPMSQQPTGSRISPNRQQSWSLAKKSSSNAAVLTDVDRNQNKNERTLRTSTQVDEKQTAGRSIQTQSLDLSHLGAGKSLKSEIFERIKKTSAKNNNYLSIIQKKKTYV